MAGKKKSYTRTVGLMLFSLILGIFLVIEVYLQSGHKLLIKNALTPLPPTHTFVLPKGTYIGFSVFDQNFNTVAAAESQLHLHFAIVGAYQAWGEKNNSFRQEWANAVSSDGSLPLITWEPWVPVSGYDRSESAVDQKDYRLVQISKGVYDKYIHQFARDVAEFRKPIVIRFAHEMNGNWYSWGSTLNTPAEYVAAWKHVHDIFIKEGATNVLWLWAPNEVYVDTSVPYADKINEFYPGDEYVDIVGLSSFNWAAQYKQNSWKDPEALFDSTIQALTPFHKPIFIAETASAETNTPQLKAGWMDKLAAYITKKPQVKAVIWFDVADNGINWKIDSTPLSAKTFVKDFSTAPFEQYYH